MNETAVSLPFDALLERSEAFEEAITVCFPGAGLVLAIADQKHELVATASTLSIEHASVLRAAFVVSAPNSGAAVLRIQYEALLRAAWLLYAASPDHIAKLARSLDLEAEQAAKNLPGSTEMLEAVVKKAPLGLSAPIVEFNQYSRHALNSFVHSGIHPLRRAREGFPLEIATTIVRISNGLMHIAYRMLASLSGSQRLTEKVTRVFQEFTDCVPIAQTSPTPDAFRTNKVA
jgi:hypothetical protein